MNSLGLSALLFAGQVLALNNGELKIHNTVPFAI